MKKRQNLNQGKGVKLGSAGSSCICGSCIGGSCICGSCIGSICGSCIGGP